MRVAALFLSAFIAAAPLEAATKRHAVGRHQADPPFGVSIDVSSGSAQRATAQVDAAAAAGVRWIRVPFLWSLIQPQASNLADLSLYGPIVARASQDNLQIVAVVENSTPWNTTAPAFETDPAQRLHYPPADYDAWARFLTFIVGTYKNNVHAWEIWNEPDVGGAPAAGQTCTGSWCGTPGQYARLLAVSYKAIKAADPGATVLFGSLALNTNISPDFLYEVLIDPDNTPAFDGIAFYAFGAQSDISRKVSAVKTDLLYSGADLRPMWINFGYPSDPAAQTAAPYFGGEAGQAAYLKDISAFLLAFKPAKLFWFELADDTTSTYGLMTSDLSKKKQAYSAYSDVIKAWTP